MPVRRVLFAHNPAAPAPQVPLADARSTIAKAADAVLDLPIALRIEMGFGGLTRPLLIHHLDQLSLAPQRNPLPAFYVPQRDPGLRHEQFTQAFQALGAAQHAPDAWFYEQAIETAQTLLAQLEDRGHRESHITEAAQDLAHVENTLGRAHDTLRAETARRQSRLPLTAGPLRNVRHTPLDPTDAERLNTSIRHALEATRQQDIIRHVADAAFHTAQAVRIAERPDFKAWFLARTLLEAKRLHLVGLSGALIRQLRDAHGDNVPGWRDAFSALETVDFRNEAIAEMVGHWVADHPGLVMDHGDPEHA